MQFTRKTDWSRQRVWKRRPLHLYPTYCPPWWCQANLRSDLRRDPRCSQGLFGERDPFDAVTYTEHAKRKTVTAYITVQESQCWFFLMNRWNSANFCQCIGFKLLFVFFYSFIYNIRRIRPGLSTEITLHNVFQPLCMIKFKNSVLLVSFCLVGKRAIYIELVSVKYLFNSYKVIAKFLCSYHKIYQFFWLIAIVKNGALVNIEQYCFAGEISNN